MTNQRASVHIFSLFKIDNDMPVPYSYFIITLMNVLELNYNYNGSYFVVSNDFMVEL